MGQPHPSNDMNQANVVPIAPSGGQNGSQNSGPATGFAFGGVGGDALRGLLRLLAKRAWWAAGCVALTLATAALYIFVTPPTYRALTTLEIFRDESRQVSAVDGEMRAAATIDREFYETQFGLLRSPSLARDTARRLRLTSNDKFMDRKNLARPSTPDEIKNSERGAARKILDNLEVVPTRESRLVDIRFVDQDPVLAAQVANAMADIYIRSNLVRRIERTEYARQFLTERISETRGKLEDQERKLIDYAAQAKIISVPSSSSADKSKGASQTAGQSLAGIELASMSEELAKARADRAEAQGRLSTVRGGDINRTEILFNNTIGGLIQKRAQLRGDIARISTQFDDDYPPLMAARNEADQIQRQLDILSGQIRGSIQNDFRAATQREATLQAKVDNLTNDLVSLSRKSIQYNILQRDVDTSRVQYESLLQRLKEVSIANDVGSSNVSVILRADPPTARFAPVPFRILLIGLFAGILLSIMVVLLLELLDSSVTTPEDAAERFDIPLIGVTPTTGSEDPLTLISDPKSALNEAYLSAHASLRFTSGQGAPHVLAITSTQASEGKSTTAIAIAAIFARQGERVLLIDCDMRRPSLHKRMGTSNEFGFANLLAGEDSFDKSIQATTFPRVSLIPAGPHPPSPAELLAGPRLGEVLQLLRARYDRIILDSPPILGLADSPLIGSAADGILFVVESNSTRTGAVRRSIERLRDLHGNVVGMLLTKYVLRRSMFSEYGYGAYEYYGYGKRKPGE